MNTDIRFFHPFSLFITNRQSLDPVPRHPADDLNSYGFSFDLTTECYFYTYDWGYGFNLRLLGFGFEFARYG